MNDVLVPEKNGVIDLNTEVAKHVISIFPLARLSDLVFDALKENEGERFMQNYSSIQQIQELRALYYLMMAKIPGMDMMFPIVFSGQGEAGAKDEFVKEIFWVGSHEYPIEDCTQLCQVITVSNCKKHDVSFELNMDSDFKMKIMAARHSLPDNYRKEIIKIMRVISPELFNEIFYNFFKLLHVYVPCLEVEDKETMFSEHPKDCAFCRNEHSVLIERTFRPQFNPAGWLEFVTTVDGWVDAWKKK